MTMADWQLGIDFGTSYTVAAVARGNEVSVIDVESNGRSRMPSCVFLTPEGEVLVGTAAQHQAVFSPERFEPTPKRSMGEGDLFLGDRLVPVTELAAAVLQRVYTEACRQQGETTPSIIRLTHPAEWAETRLSTLREAVDRAQLSNVSFIAEPVAAAARIALSVTPPGRHVAVYDFGGGTMDAAVLLRTADGFDIAGPPAGRDPLGGEDIDRRIVGFIGEVLGGDHAQEWEKLLRPPDVAWRRDAATLREEVQRAKETLSEVTACQLWIPGVERDIQLTRSELEELIASDIEATVDTLQTAIEDSHVKPGDLAGLYLVGGSSRMPIVADAIWRRLEIRPAVQDNPKSVVAMGAAGWTTILAGNTSSVTTGERAVVAGTGSGAGVGEPGASDSESAARRSTIAMSVGRDDWAAGCECTVEIVVDYQGIPPATLRVREEPTDLGGSELLARRIVRVREERTPGYREMAFARTEVFGDPDGFERKFSMASSAGSVAMFERYLVNGGRAYVMAGPESARDVADTIAIGRPLLPKSDWFESRFEIPETARWTIGEKITLRRRGTSQAVTAERIRLAPDVEPQSWMEGQIENLSKRLSNCSIIGKVPSTVLGQLEGEIVTLKWSNNGTPSLTKLGIAVHGRDGYSVAISLPHVEQSHFAPLARQARLHPLNSPIQ